MYQGIVTMSPDDEGCTGLEYQKRVQSWGEHLLEQSYPACVMLAIADNNYHRFVSGLEDANWSIFDSIMVWNYPQPERVVIARTPRQGLTYVQCLEQFGTGSLNIDDTRIHVIPVKEDRWGTMEYITDSVFNNPTKLIARTGNNKGRWGANTILVHHPNCSDEQCVMDCHVHIMGEQSGETHSSGGGGHRIKGHHTRNGIYGVYPSQDRPKNVGHGDTGTASRFFYQGRSRQDVMDYLVTLIRPPTENPTLLIQTERIAE